MANQVLRFVRGVDFSGTHFDGKNPFPPSIDQLLNVRWLRLNDTNLESIPTAVNRLAKLEHLYVEENRLLCIPPSIRNLTHLRAFRASCNDLSQEDICGDLFSLEELSVVDLSHNTMSALPPNVQAAKGLIALSVSHNQLGALDTTVLKACVEMELLDLTHNKLTHVPPELRYLSGLRTLLLSENDLDMEDLCPSICSLADLEHLELAATNRTDANIPIDLVRLRRLRHLDLSRNPLGAVPSPVLGLAGLERLNLSDCTLTEIPAALVDLKKLQFLNISRNKLPTLPDEICQLRELVRLFANSTGLTCLPQSIGSLNRLEELQLANNELTTVPDDLARCTLLSRLDVHGNHLATLPLAVLELPVLKNIDFSYNPGFKRPERRQAVDDLSVSLASLSVNDPRNGARPLGRSGSMRNSMRFGSPSKRPESQGVQRDEAREAQVLHGLAKLSQEGHREPSGQAQQMNEELGKRDQPTKLKSYQKPKPRIDYSEMFADEVGQEEGLTVFRLENFLPTLLAAAEFGIFYEADTYLVLNTEKIGGDLRHTIYFWIGSLSSLDKKASAAMQAVALRDHLMAVGPTKREEQGEESMEFLALFQNSINIVQGGTEIGFYGSKPEVSELRLYFLEDRGSLRAHGVALSGTWLHDSHAFLLEDHEHFFLWCGKNTPLLLRSKARLFGEKAAMLSAGKMDLIEVIPGKEPAHFWNVLGGKPANLGSDFVLPTQRTKLHEMRLGDGFLEVPQVVQAGARLESRLLDSRGVYILDDHSDVWVWIGRRSSRLVRAAANKMCANLKDILPRPVFVATFRVTEGNESQVFRSKFDRWDDVVLEDHRPAELSVAQDGKTATAAATAVAVTPPRINVNDMFLPPPAVDEQRMAELEEQAHNKIEDLNVFILENFRTQRLGPEVLGQFYSGNCYIVYVKQWRRVESSSEEEVEFRLYFWQGIDAPLYLWAFFCANILGEFSKGVKEQYGLPVLLSREFQQRESDEFMMLFRHRMIVHQGRRGAQSTPVPRLFWTHVYRPRVFTRTLQVANDSKLLNTEDCFTLVVPFDEKNGVMYVWIGAKADPDDAIAAQTVARDHLRAGFTEQTISQGREPRHFFWAHLDENQANPNFPGLAKARLFLCSYREGYFRAVECRPSFCQDSLDDTTTAILDNGADVFLWTGKRSSPAANRMALRAANEYLQLLPSERRTNGVRCVEYGQEPWEFSRAFFGWKSWDGVRCKSLLARPSYLGCVSKVANS